MIEFQIVAQTMVARRRALLTKISLLRRMASNGLQVSNKDRCDLVEPFEQTHRICIWFCLALFCCR